MKVIVLAGGGGTRLWPLSRESFPKQFLNFGSGPSLLQKTVQRLLKAPFVEDVIVSTNEHHLALVQAQLQKIDARVRIVVEPLRRNTAPAIGLAVKYLEEICGATSKDPVLVVPSDHLIEPEKAFIDNLAQAMKVVPECKIITFGIKPTRAETGYGYIETGKQLNEIAYEVRRFVEKPNLQTAESYLKSGNFFWNSGMFLFSVEAFWKEMQAHSPQISALFKFNLEEVIARFTEMPDVSIDYALMEKTKHILVCPLDVIWSDIGSWDSIYEVMEKDQDQNVKIGNVLAIDTKNSLIMGNKRIVSTIGLENMLIVETADAIFISKKGESQKIKNLVQQLSKADRS